MDESVTMSSNRRQQRIKRHNKDAVWQKLHGGYFGGGVQQRRQDKSQFSRIKPSIGHLVLSLTARGHLRSKPKWIALTEKK